MTWDVNAPYRAESRKIVWQVAPYLRGRGIDVGAGTFKVLPQAISVDNGTDNVLFGMAFRPDVWVPNAEELGIFGSKSMDFVYSSHLLEHLEHPQKALHEWWRLIKDGGVMILYLPHDELYPKVGEPGANVDHKHNLNEAKVIAWFEELPGGWDLERCERRNQDDEYSFLMILRKVKGGHRFSYLLPKPLKTACVVRYGAFGDMMMASPIFRGLKAEGYHVTVFASPPGSDVITNDPNIDKLVLFDKDQVPNGDLGAFWEAQAKNFDRFVNLSESCEGSLLAIVNRAPYLWPPKLRHSMMNRNYVEFAHEVAGLPHDPKIVFYPTAEEVRWASLTRERMKAKQVLLWSLAGSSVHKTWAGLDNIVASVLTAHPDCGIVFVGGLESKILEQGWEKEPRVYRRCGEWTIRQSLAFLSQVDVVIGPETGILNAAASLDAIKILFLSHSTHENLSRDWRNVIALTSEKTTCPGRGNNEAPACHQLHYGWQFCRKVEEMGVAACQADISVEEVWGHVDWALQAAAAHKKGKTVPA